MAKLPPTWPDPWACKRTKTVIQIIENHWTTERECEFVDTSVHRYVCTVCNQEFWYSAKGMVAEQNGVTIWDVDENYEVTKPVRKYKKA